MVVINSVAYVAPGEAGLRIFTLTNMASPRLLGRFSGAANARAVAVSGSRAYVADGNSIKIISISNPGAPSLVTAYTNQSLGSIRNLAYSGSRLLVSDGRKVL